MIYLRGIYDSASKRLIIEFKNGLLENYFEVLVDCFKNYQKAGSLPQGIELNKLEDTRCAIIVPVDLVGGNSLVNGQDISGSLPKGLTDKLTEVIENFKNKAMKEEFSTTEFIPLSGYPVKDLQNDIKEAIKNKRNFCIIESYQEYLRFSKGDTSKINQAKVKFLSNEYSDVAIYIYEGNMKKLKDMFKGRLTESDWG